MKWINRWIERKVDEALKTRTEELDTLNQKLRKLEVHITEKSENLKKTIDDVANFLWKIERAVSVKENIETVMNVSSNKDILYLFEQVREDTLAKTRGFNAEADALKEDMIPFEVSTGKPFEYEVLNGVGMTIMAIKFLSGKGYGKYVIQVNGRDNTFFVKRQNGNEDGAILRTRLIFLRQHDLLRIRQTDGAGRLKCALYVAIAGPRRVLLAD